MELHKIIFDRLNGYSFGYYRQRGKLVHHQSLLCWLSTMHTKDELKKIYPNISIIDVESQQLGNFEKNIINSLIKDTDFIESESYKIGIFNSQSYYMSIEYGMYYFFDWKSDSCEFSTKYYPLSRKNISMRCHPMTQDIWREIQLSRIL
jgi:hypothetical protein